jgi:uncharacterized protein YaaN involved in tellurite resistance
METEHNQSAANSPISLKEIKGVEVSPEDRERIDKIKKGIDLSESNMIVQYGVGTQSRLSDFADGVLSEIHAKDAGFVGDMLSDLLVNVKKLEIGDLEGGSGFLSSLPLIGGLFDRFKRFLAEYETLSVQIEKITDKLDEARIGLLRDITFLDGLFEKNVGYFRDLGIFIQAGEEKVAELSNTLLPSLKAKAEQSSDPLEAQKYDDIVKAVNRFEKRIHDLKLSKTISLQTMPQIRLVQSGNQELAEKIQSSILNTIPLWKNQIVLAISLMRQKNALELQKEVSETTNELLRKNAEMLKQGTIEIAQESERGIVDIETLQKVNADLISTIEEVIRIQQEGRNKRQVAEQELLKIENDLKQKMVSQVQ